MSVLITYFNHPKFLYRQDWANSVAGAVRSGTTLNSVICICHNADCFGLIAD